MNLKQRFDKLSKLQKVLICLIIIVILGSFIFSMGNEIGEAFYKALQ